MLRRFKQKALEKAIAPKVEKEYGGGSLNNVAKGLRASVKLIGVKVMRDRIIKAIEGDFKKAAKGKEPEEAVTKLIRDATTADEYMALLDDIGMDESHLNVLAGEALEKRNGGNRSRKKGEKK